MKTTISILLLSIYLFTATQLSELFKFPAMIEHYVEHHQENPQMDFFAFLSLHYTNGEVFDADYSKDMKLPFKSHGACCSCSSLISYCVPNQTFHFFYSPFCKEYKKPQFSYTFSFYSKFESSIWQPPKIVSLFEIPAALNSF